MDRPSVAPLFLHNALFINFYKRPRKIKAILIDNGMIKKVYLKKPLLPKNVEKYDLKGSYVIPGFIDSHTHLIARGMELQRTDLEDCKSLKDCLEKLRSELHKNNELLFGSNWDESDWHQPRRNDLNRHTLDKISKAKPVIMRRICGHFAVANTKALNLIPKKWKFVDRRNGYLYEDAALNLNEIFEPSGLTLEKAVLLGMKEAVKNGITSVHEITNLRQLRLLQKIKRRSGLKIRFSIYMLLKYYKNILSPDMSIGLGDNFLKFAGIKIFLDGSIGARTAAFTKPYRNAKIRGKILISADRLSRIVRTAEESGIQLMLHSIGDRTTNQILKVFEKNISRKNPLRHRLEHIELLNDSSLRKIANMSLIASVQPNFVRRWQNHGAMYEQLLGKRYEEMNCFKRLLDQGIKVVFGSDCMPLGPLYGIRGALEHPFYCGRLNAREAFKIYTREGAYATFDENKIGAIDKGNLADLVVLNKNPLKEKDLTKIKILMTLVGGNTVYRSANLQNEN